MDNSGWDEETCIWSSQFDSFSEELLVTGRVEMMNRALVSSSMDLHMLHGEGSIETADSMLPNLVTEAAMRGAAPPFRHQLSSIPPPCISSVESDSSRRPERPLKQRPGSKRKRGENSSSLLNCSSSSTACGGFQISFSTKEMLGSGYELDAEGIVQVKEMIYRAAALRPVSSDAEAAVEKPRRKNVRISSDPQTVAARQRRERISERLRVLQRLVPGGSKMDTASMLDEAASYLKFLKAQVSSLEKLGVRSTAGRSTMISTVGPVNFREEADHPPCANPKAWCTTVDQPDDDGSYWFRVRERDHGFLFLTEVSQGEGENGEWQ